jgi:hypothetical protein
MHNAYAVANKAQPVSVVPWRSVERKYCVTANIGSQLKLTSNAASG